MMLQPLERCSEQNDFPVSNELQNIYWVTRPRPAAECVLNNLKGSRAGVSNPAAVCSAGLRLSAGLDV